MDLAIGLDYVLETEWTSKSITCPIRFRSLEPAQGRSLTKIKAIRRLVSYFHTKEKADEFSKYVRTGRNENLSRSNRTRE